MVYAEDEIAVTPVGTPVIVDVTSNDFVKGMDELTVTHTGGSSNGKCEITNNNQVQYVPNKDFEGLDFCGYVVCRHSICDEGVLGIKVTSQKVSSKKPMKSESSNNNGSDKLVSNFESSSGLTIGINEPQRERPDVELSDVAIHCQEDGEGENRNLRGFRQLRKLRKNAPCIGSSMVVTSPLGNDEISYISTYHTTEADSSTLVPAFLRFGRIARSKPVDTSTEESESAYIETIIKIPASADAVIMPGFPDKCFGNVPSLLVGSAASSAGRHETLLQFETSEVDYSWCNDGIVSASIHLYSLVDSRQGGIFVTTSNNNWSENSVTWNNAPPSDGIVLKSIASGDENQGYPIKANHWYDVDVSSALILGEALGIRILSDKGEMSVAQYASREHSDKSLKPVLKITCFSLAVAIGDGNTNT